MPGNNYNYDAGYIMNSDRISVDNPMGSNQLTREKLEFDTRAVPDPLTQYFQWLKTDQQVTN